MADDSSYPLLRKPFVMGLLVFVLVTILTQYLTYQQYVIRKDEERQKVTHEMEVVKGRLTTALSYSLSATKTLAYIIEQYGEPQDFAKAAKTILESNKFIDALQLTRKGVITHVYPLKGNEAAIGLDVLADPLRSSEAYEALEKKELFFAGPLELKQGGVAVVGRLPIFIDDDFWGFSVAVIKLSTLLKAAGIDTLQSGNFIYQVSKIDPNTLKEEFLLPGTIPVNQGQFVFVNVPSGEWKLHAVPKNNSEILFTIMVFSFIGLMLSVTAASFARQLVKQPQELKKLVEEKTRQLSASEKYFRALIENSSDAVVLLDGAGKVLYQSPSTDRILGYTLKEIQALDGLQLIYPEDRDEDLTMFAQLVQSPNSVFSRSHRTKHKDGHYVWIEGTYTNLLNDENVGAVVYNYRDVTRKVEAEQRLTTSEALYSQLIHHLPVAVYNCDTEGRALIYNQAAINLWGRVPQVGSDLWCGSWKIFKPDGTFLPLEDWPMALSVKEKRASLGEEIIIERPDGSQRNVVVNPTPVLDSKKNITGYVNILIDITDQKKATQNIIASEMKYRTTLERVSDAFVALDRNWCYTYMNVKAGAIFGRDPQQMIGKHIWTEFPEGIGQPFYNAYHQAMEEQKYVHLEEYYSPYNLWFENHIYPSQDGLSIYFKDVTQRKKAEREIIHSQFRLQSILENTTDLIWLVDKDYKLLFSNSHYKDFLLKLTGKEIQLGNNVKDFISDTYEDGLLMLYERALNGERFSVEQIRNYNGKEASIEYFFNPIRNAQNEVTGFSAFTRDITDRKTAERKLVESEEHYRSLIEQASDAIFIANSKGQYIDVNTNASTLLGYTREELLNMNGKDILFYEENIKLLPQGYQMLRGGKWGITETRLKRKDGTPVDVETNSKMLTDGRFVGIVRDITQRKNAERTLTESENRLRTIIQTEPECVKLLGLQGELIEMNPAGLAMIEADNFEQVKGKSMWSIINKPNRKAFEALTKNVFNGVSGTLEFEITGLKGASRWLETHATPLKDAEGKIIFLLGITRDITERKKAAAQIKTERIFSDSLINSLPGIFYLYDKEGKFARWNKNFETISGYSAYEISQMHPFDFYDTDEKKLIQKKIDTVFTYGKDEVAAHFYTKDKRKIPYYFNGHRISLNGNDYLTGVGIDISDRVASEKELIEYTAKIKELTAHLEKVREDERTRIAREIHDELGQQLTGLKIDASWISKKMTREDKSIKDKISTMILLIDETVKSVRRISSQLRPGILDDLGLIAALEWESQEFEKRTGIKVYFSSEHTYVNVEGNLPINIFRIHQEALTNIARHARATQIITTLVKKNGCLNLAIKDNGIGFDVEETKGKKSWGLIGMRERALLFKGELTIESERLKGTVITLRVPLAEPAKQSS